jgi:hypothetical protein
MKMLRSSHHLSCALVLISLTAEVSGQQPTAQPTGTPNAEVERLRSEIEVERLRTALAEQKKKTLAAILPESDDAANKTLKGEITVADKTNALEIESVTLSYQALSILARKITSKIRSDAGDVNQLVIYSDTDFTALIQYRFFKSQAEPALKAYETLLATDSSLKRGASTSNSWRGVGSEVLQFPTIGTAVIKSAIDLISLFRTDTQITNRKVNIDESALGVLVADEAKSVRPGLRVYFPKAYTPDHNWNPEDQESVLTQLMTLYAYRAVVKAILADYEKTLPAEKEKHIYHRQVPALTALNEQVGRLLANYENKEGETAGNRLRELLRAEQLSKVLESDANTAILQLKVLEAGGSERITRNLIFGSKVKHSGGAIVEYMLFDKGGALRSSQLFYHHTGFQEMNKPQDR